jgi:hypothetical protein
MRFAARGQVDVIQAERAEGPVQYRSKKSGIYAFEQNRLGGIAFVDSRHTSTRVRTRMVIA